MPRETDTDRITDKIAALLRLAEGAATDGEREAALAQAAKLAAKYNIELQSIDSTAPDGFEESYLSNYATEPLWLAPVMSLLTEYFFVAYYLLHQEGQRSRVMLVGQKHNLAIAVHVYVFLSRSFADGWKAFSKRRGTRAGERSYHEGVLAVLDDRLRRERDQYSTAEQTALIRVGSGAHDALAKRYPDVQERAASAPRSIDTEAFLQGIADGREIQIRKALRSAADDSTTFLEASA